MNAWDTSTEKELQYYLLYAMYSLDPSFKPQTIFVTQENLQSWGTIMRFEHRAKLPQYSLELKKTGQFNWTKITNQYDSWHVSKEFEGMKVYYVRWNEQDGAEDKLPVITEEPPAAEATEWGQDSSIDMEESSSLPDLTPWSISSPDRSKGGLGDAPKPPSPPQPPPPQAPPQLPTLQQVPEVSRMGTESESSGDEMEQQNDGQPPPPPAGGQLPKNPVFAEGWKGTSEWLFPPVRDLGALPAGLPQQPPPPPPPPAGGRVKANLDRTRSPMGRHLEKAAAPKGPPPSPPPPPPPAAAVMLPKEEPERRGSHRTTKKRELEPRGRAPTRDDDRSRSRIDGQDARAKSEQPKKVEPEPRGETRQRAESADERRPNESKMPKKTPESDDTVEYPANEQDKTVEYPVNQNEESTKNYSLPLIDTSIFNRTPQSRSPVKAKDEEESPLKSDVSPGSPNDDNPVLPLEESMRPMADSLKSYTEVQGTRYSSFDFEDLDNEEKESKGTWLEREDKLARDEDAQYQKDLDKATERSKYQQHVRDEMPDERTYTPGVGSNDPIPGAIPLDDVDITDKELLDIAMFTRYDEATLDELTCLAKAVKVYKYKKKSPVHELMQPKDASKSECSAADVKKHYHEFEKAKQTEIGSWKEAKAFRREKYDPNKHGDPLPGRWVPTKSVEKNEDGTPKKVKQRWTIRGDLCPYRNRVDNSSPASTRTGELFLHSWCVRHGFEQFTLDIKTAFLRGEKVTRLIATWPPPEAEEEEDVVWVLEVMAYGMAEAPAHWHKSLDNTLVNDLKMQKSKCELVLYMYRGPKTNKVVGMLVIHIDDLLGGGDKGFHANVIGPLKKKYPFGSEDWRNFKFTGINCETVENGMRIDQKGYIKTMKEVPIPSDWADTDAMDWKHQTAHRSLQGTEMWVAARTRADSAYEASAGASKNNNGTIGDLRQLNKHPKHLKSTVETHLFFPELGPDGTDDQGKLRWLVLCDSALHNAEEGRSQRGILIWLTLDRSSDEKPVVAHLIYWESKKGERVARSSLSAETQSVQAALNLARFLNLLFQEVSGYLIPIDVRTDAESLCTLTTVKRPGT